MIKLPIFIELKFKDLNITSLVSNILNSNISMQPLYFRIKEKDFSSQEKAQDFIDTIQKILNEHKISFFFPYPLFAINETPFLIKSSITIVDSKQNLPSFFKHNQNITITDNKNKLLLEKLEKLKIQAKHLSLHDIHLKSETSKNVFKYIWTLKREIKFLQKIL